MPDVLGGDCFRCGGQSMKKIVEAMGFAVQALDLEYVHV